ncbi:S41 family peptidase [Bacillus horti]|uniref:C-terminal processing protease CtpA/Prc n=1 Tax=Caldalkalibacillus horti TaxID=77523 RepID=A0ABT9VU37_9BACI|nr:S41 family peptidase [Bacillus horti]MDQ0164499.1 C-terminal processing protease CtpA/Prc [Bacillus horti]
MRDTEKQIVSPLDGKGIVTKVIELLEANYVVTEKTEEIVEGIKKKLDEGQYESLDNYEDLANVLTTDLLELSGDKHLYVRAIAKDKGESKLSLDDWLKQEREEEITENYGFTEAKILDGNIGYLKITGFMHPDRGIDTCNAAMKFLENTKAIVIDIRNNGGGYGGLSEYLISYFFDEMPTHLSTTYFMEEGATEAQTFSHSFVVGKRRVEKEHKLYILVNEKTVSAAEYFAYVLQANKKAIIVGETSAGGAYRNTYFPLNEKLRISISTGRPIIKATGTSWEGVGVIPDLPCNSDHAIELALEHIGA